MKPNQYDEVLKLFNSYIIFVNTDKKIVELFLDDDVEIAHDLTYDEFCDVFVNTGKFDDDSKGKMSRFLNQLNVGDDNIFNLQITYHTQDGENVPLLVRGRKISNSKVILSISSEYIISNTKVDNLTRLLTMNSLIPIVNKKMVNNEDFILIVIDIDNFNTFVAKHGSMFGDILLVETAAYLKRIIKTDGYVARESKDRFLLLLDSNDNYDFIHEQIAKLRNTIMQLISHNIKQESITVTMGASRYPTDGDSFDTLYKKANLALERGKKKGRNCFIMYTEEKCGSLESYDLEEKILTSASSVVTNFNIISGIYELLNREGSKAKNILDALSLTGSYFQLDRINLFLLNPETKKIIKIHQWCNPLAKPHPLKPNQNNVDLWHKSYDNIGMVKINQVDSNKHLPIYNILKEADISAMLALDLLYTDIEVGLLRFEMCNTNRFWNQNEISALTLISKLFAIFIYKEYQSEYFEKKLSYDKLTGLYNFTKWIDVVYENLNDIENSEYSIISLSFDDYLHIADVLGTDIITSSFKYIANTIIKYSDKEIYTRVADDRFYILSPTLDTEYLKDYITKIFNDITNNYKYGHHLNLRAGVYLHNKKEDITKAIDKSSLVRTKAIEYDTPILFFKDEYYEIQMEQNKLELHQNKALENDEFKLYLQPKINTKTNKIAGAEALTRWKYKNEKMIYPNVFIPLFENNGFIKNLDLHIFEKVCQFQRKVIDLGYDPVTISVNLSMYQTNLDEYFNKINEIREQYNIPAKYLEIEITESTYVKKIDRVINLMKKLHNAGYQVSMDDFGTGYSNLSSLATFDFDTIKLDKNFCSNTENDRERTILKFIVRLARSLNIKILCEGVETVELVNFLKEIGCTLIQGYYFDKPMPSDDLLDKYLKK